MAFEIYRTNRTLSGQSGSVRADRQIDTGAGITGRAIAGAGSVLQALGEKWDLQVADTQLTKAKGLARTEHYSFREKAKGLNPEDYEKAYKESMQQRKLLTPKNPRAAKAYSDWMLSIEPYFMQDKNELLKAKIIDDHRAVGFEERQRFIETGNGMDFFTHLAKGVRLGAYDKEEAAKLKQYALEARERYAITENALAKEKAKEELELIREEDRDKIYGMIRNGEPIDNVIESTFLDEKEQEAMYDRQRIAIERRMKGEEIITNISSKQDILDMIATIHDSGGSTPAEIRKRAYDGRYGDKPYLADNAYDEVRDALRKAIEDKIPFTEVAIEKGIGELMTGAPSSVLGLPLPTLRTREDAIRHATNLFGRYVNRIPGVMEAINAKYPPDPTEKKSVTNEPKGEPAYHFDGTQIGNYNPDGSITLNAAGVRILLQIANGDVQKANEIALQNRYVIPRTE